MPNNSTAAVPRLGRVALVIMAAGLIVACGGSSPTAPTPSPPPPPAATVAQIAGPWAGTLTMTMATVSPGRFDVAIRADLQQTDRAVRGTWTITTPGNDTTGEITGTLDGTEPTTTFEGTVTWSTETDTGTARCRGTSAFSGPATGATIRWTSPGVDWAGTCSDPPRDLVWTLTKP